LIVLQYNETCLKCGKLYSHVEHVDDYYRFDINIRWCKICSVKYVQKNICNWSGSKEDDLIKKQQQKAIYLSDFFEWIPYNHFENIEKIEEGELSAIWKDGYLKEYNEEDNKFSRRKNLKVILKNMAKYSHEVYVIFIIYFNYPIIYNITYYSYIFFFLNKKIS
jgi:hypothetical protein